MTSHTHIYPHYSHPLIGQADQEDGKDLGAEYLLNVLSRGPASREASTIAANTIKFSHNYSQLGFYTVTGVSAMSF